MFLGGRPGDDEKVGHSILSRKSEICRHRIRTCQCCCRFPQQQQMLHCGVKMNVAYAAALPPNDHCCHWSEEPRNPRTHRGSWAMCGASEEQ
eukprot:909420-Pyramimonas_sp.AAC.1